MSHTKTLYLAVVLSLFGFTHQAHAVPVAVVDGTGQLTGIDGIQLLGDTWNVQFIDGTALTIFGSSPVFDFSTQAAAEAASMQLLTTFHTPGFEMFDTQPGSVFGVGQANLNSRIITPYQDNGTFALASAYNNIAAGFSLDTISLLTASYTTNTTFSTQFVYADWTNVSAVPVPAAVYLMGTGLIGLMGFSRKNKSQVAA